MKQIATQTGDVNIATEQTVLTFALPAGPDAYALKAEIRAGDGTKNLTGGAYTIRGTAGGIRVFRSDTVVEAGVVRRIFDVEFLGRPGETVTLTLQNATGTAETVGVTAYLYTGVNVVEISEDEEAANRLESLLDLTGGIVLMAAQLKLACDVVGEGALDCRNANMAGMGQYNDGGYVGQYNYCPIGVGQYNDGGYVGQHNSGVEAVRNEGIGPTPKALTLIGAVDRIDDILADTDALDGRLPAIPAAQGDVTTAHATTDGKVDGVAAGVWAVGTRTLTSFGTLVADAAAAAATAVWVAAARTLTAFGFTVAGAKDGVIDTIAGQVDVKTSEATTAILNAVVTREAAGAAATAAGQIRGGTRTLESLATPDNIPTPEANAAKAEEVLAAAHGEGSWEGIAESDWSVAERKQIRDALGVVGDKVTAADGQVQAIKAKTDTIGSVAVTYTTPAVTPGGPWEIHCGSAYLAADGRAIDLTITGYGGPPLAPTGTLRLLARHKWAADADAAADLEVEATVAQNGTTVVLSADLNAVATAALEPSPPRDIENYRVQFWVTPDEGEPFVIGEGDLTAKKGIAAAQEEEEE